MKRKLKWIFAALLVAFALLQFTNPPRTNPPVTNDFISAEPPPEKIAVMLRAACYDCHSHETRWPWYSRIAPMSWQIADDVKVGRMSLNLSDWPTNDLRTAKKLGSMSEEIGYENMPMKKYILIHADARFTATQRKELTDWLDAEAKRLKALAEK